jgi:hypothetical protein
VSIWKLKFCVISSGARNLNRLIKSDFSSRRNDIGVSEWTLVSVHPETALKIPKLKLWTPNNGHLGVQSFSFGSVSEWTLVLVGWAHVFLFAHHIISSRNKRKRWMDARNPFKKRDSRLKKNFSLEF